jgi:hypothetical protein
MRFRKISVGFDRPPKPRDRFLPNTEVVLRCARGGHPDVCHRIAWTETQGLGNVRFGFLGTTNKDLTNSDVGVRVSEILIQRQRMFALAMPSAARSV